MEILGDFSWRFALAELEGFSLCFRFGVDFEGSLGKPSELGSGDDDSKNGDKKSSPQENSFKVGAHEPILLSYEVGHKWP